MKLADRSNRLLLDKVDPLREAVRAVKRRHPFKIVAWVVLPDHMHAIWTLPVGDADYAKRWMMIKAGFSRQIDPGERINASRRSKGERGIWQRRYWEHTIADEVDLQRHVDYVHFNPVKHGYVGRACDWPYSSIHRYIEARVLPVDWGGVSVDLSLGRGRDVGVFTPTYVAASSPQPNFVNMQENSIHEISDNFNVPYVVLPIKSLVKNHYTPKLKIFSQYNFNGKCRLLNDGKNSPWIWMLGQLPFDVLSMKAVPGTVMPTAICPSA